MNTVLADCDKSLGSGGSGSLSPMRFQIWPKIAPASRPPPTPVATDSGVYPLLDTGLPDHAEMASLPSPFDLRNQLSSNRTQGIPNMIALVRAGIEGAVAPLGTAITEDQLRLMWRVSPEPVIALDGDAAGLRAATDVTGFGLGETVRQLVDHDPVPDAPGAAVQCRLHRLRRDQIRPGDERQHHVIEHESDADEDRELFESPALLLAGFLVLRVLVAVDRVFERALGGRIVGRVGIAGRP